MENIGPWQSIAHQRGVDVPHVFFGSGHGVTKGHGHDSLLNLRDVLAEYFLEMAEEAQAGKLSVGDMKVVRDELDSIAAKGAMPLELHHARAKIESALAAATPPVPPAAAPQPAAEGVA